MSFQHAITDAHNVRALRERSAEIVQCRDHISDLKKAERVAREQYNQAQLLIYNLQYERELAENRLAELEAS